MTDDHPHEQQPAAPATRRPTQGSDEIKGVLLDIATAAGGVGGLIGGVSGAYQAIQGRRPADPPPPPTPELPQIELPPGVDHD
jgi:hypothetical protein